MIEVAAVVSTAENATPSGGAGRLGGHMWECAARGFPLGAIPGRTTSAPAIPVPGR